MPVHFHTEDITFILKKSTRLKSWISRVILSEYKKPGNLNFIFCSDEYLLQLNRQYLKHDTYTDILTFNHASKPDLIEGDIFISIERVRENALKLKIEFEDELHRVMIHGVLHLLRYDDKKPSSKNEMRKKEDECLRIR